MKKYFSLQDIIFKLQKYWSDIGCLIMQPLDIEIGAGTFHPATFLRAIGPEPWKAVYIQPTRRPKDGRYAKSFNRMQYYYQLQVIIKPSPLNMQELYLNSLSYLGIDLTQEDIRFIEDDWESPSLGAWGLGWEIWQNGMEISQFTYFQQMGGMNCNPIPGEITYGIERIAMNIQNVNSILDIIWSNKNCITYGDILKQNEYEMSTYNFLYASIPILLEHFNFYENECNYLLNKKLSIPSYEMLLKASQIFNLLDARNAISVNERKNFILRLQYLSKIIAKSYFQERKVMGFPLCNKVENVK